MFIRTGHIALLTVFLAASSTTHAATFADRATDAAVDTAMLDAPLSRYRALEVDLAGLRKQLAKAPDEFSGEPAAEVDLPTAEGGTQHYFVWRTQVMANELAARYPQIRSYVARASDRGGVEARIDDSPHGVSAMIRTPDGVTMLQPVRLGGGSRYIAFRRDNLGAPAAPFQCHEDGGHATSLVVPQENPMPQTTTGAVVRTYRLAVATTGEYTQFFGGTVADGLAAIAQAINRINGIYLTEFAVRFELVANNDLIVYTNPATDPFSDGHPNQLINQVQTNITAKIGAANYDFGHLFSTGGGGLAGLGVACSNSNKARGVTGISQPVGDAYWVDYVAHEMGHQMGADHSFNTTDDNCGGNRAPDEAAEPGSGSTIMAYAGICGPSSLQPHSDAFFHAISLPPIVARLASGGGSCGSTATNTDQPPVVAAVANRTIPSRTPFVLDGSASDADGDTLTYEWDEMDLGAAAPPDNDDGSRPLFRSFTPQPTATRLVPELPRILAHDLDIDIPAGGDISGETWATTDRTLKFRLTVRDNHAGGGATVSTDTALSVTSAAGPFRVTAPASSTVWLAQAAQTVTWDVAGTDVAPVNCAAVDILYSDDGGTTFATTLASNVPNSGAASVLAPPDANTHARIEVICHDNIFFDISPGDFTVIVDEIFADGFGGD